MKKRKREAPYSGMMTMKGNHKKPVELNTNPYSPEEVEYATQQFMTDIIAFRKEASITPIRCEPVCLTEAARNCSVAVTGNNVSSLLALQEEKDKQDQEDWLSKNIGKVIVLMAFAVLPIIAYMIINR
jgi:hypothetical protein